MNKIGDGVDNSSNQYDAGKVNEPKTKAQTRTEKTALPFFQRLKEGFRATVAGIKAAIVIKNSPGTASSKEQQGPDLDIRAPTRMAPKSTVKDKPEMLASKQKENQQDSNLEVPAPTRREPTRDKFGTPASKQYDKIPIDPKTGKLIVDHSRQTISIDEADDSGSDLGDDIDDANSDLDTHYDGASVIDDDEFVDDGYQAVGIHDTEVEEVDHLAQERLSGRYDTTRDLPLPIDPYRPQISDQDHRFPEGFFDRPSGPSFPHTVRQEYNMSPYNTNDSNEDGFVSTENQRARIKDDGKSDAQRDVENMPYVGPDESYDATNRENYTLERVPDGDPYSLDNADLDRARGFISQQSELKEGEEIIPKESEFKKAEEQDQRMEELRKDIEDELGI